MTINKTVQTLNEEALNEEFVWKHVFDKILDDVSYIFFA